MRNVSGKKIVDTHRTNIAFSINSPPPPNPAFVEIM
jgi:hypothetical protein